MRAYILSIGALAVAACGPSSAGAQTPEAGTITLAQADATAAPAAATGGADLSGLPAEYQGADLAKGRQQWFLCAACHQINDGKSHSVGPDLKGIFGNTAGTNETFPLYSPSLKESGIVWTPETLQTWLENPRAVLPQTTMIFPGIRKPEDRRDVIAYLWVETGGDADP
jgi:cytochrome c